MKKSNNASMAVKKSYEEILEDDMCNFNSYASDKSDRLEKNQNSYTQNTNNNSTKKGIGSSGKRSRKNSKTGLSSLNVSQNTNHTTNYLPTVTDGNFNLTGGNTGFAGNIMELIDSLKDKISLYENEIKSLIEEKVQMQLTINNLQLSSYSSTKKSNKLNSSKSPMRNSNNYDVNQSGSNPNPASSLMKSTDSGFELNKHYMQEASGLNKELKNLKNNIDRQKALLEQECSILDESIFLESHRETNREVNIISPIRNEKNLNTEQNDINNLNQQRVMIINEIKTLREELFSLVELQKSITSDLNNNDKSGFLNSNGDNVENIIENSERQIHIDTDPNAEQKTVMTAVNNTGSMHNTPVNNSVHTNPNNNSFNTNQQSHNFLQNDSLPNIEQFFVFKNKISLVDSDKNLWHLKKCRQFENFTKKNEHIYKTREENLFAFLEYYQNLNQGEATGEEEGDNKGLDQNKLQESHPVETHHTTQHTQSNAIHIDNGEVDDEIPEVNIEDIELDEEEEVNTDMKNEKEQDNSLIISDSD